MVVKFYISMISGNKEMKKRQMKAQLIMESKGVDFKVIDICDPNSEDERRFMQKNAATKNNARNPVPPQFFNDEEYCGDYEGFDEANENDCLEEFLKLPRGSLPQVPIIIHNLSNLSSREVSVEKDAGVSINGTGSLRQTPEKAVQEDPKDGDIDEHNRYAPQDTDDAPLDREDEVDMLNAEEESDSKNEVEKKEEEEVGEVDEEEEEEEEEEEDPPLPDEDEPMEMSTTVATAERFTEFSYKQLPGEA